MSHNALRISLTISTYNRPEALRLCLLSAFRQTRLPDEIIVGDDGSTDVTRELIEELRPLCPVPLHHVWQEDKGFRLARLRNLCIAQSTGDYIVQIDGDMVLSRHFIADHAAVARRGYYVKGGRIRLNEAATQRLCQSGRPPRFFSPFSDIHHDRLKAIRIPGLGHYITPRYRRTGTGMGANTAFWREDLLRVNGYDENFEGYGGEDSDIEIRLQMAGIATFKLFRLGLALHLWHKEGSNPAIDKVRKYIEEKKKARVWRTDNGLLKNH